jgi:hypothetical protein
LAFREQGELLMQRKGEEIVLGIEDGICLPGLDWSLGEAKICPRLSGM